MKFPYCAKGWQANRQVELQVCYVLSLTLLVSRVSEEEVNIYLYLSMCEA